MSKSFFPTGVAHGLQTHCLNWILKQYIFGIKLSKMLFKQMIVTSWNIIVFIDKQIFHERMKSTKNRGEVINPLQTKLLRASLITFGWKSKEKSQPDIPDFSSLPETEPTKSAFSDKGEDLMMPWQDDSQFQIHNSYS